MIRGFAAMPDLPPPKRRPPLLSQDPLADAAGCERAAGLYAELHCKTNFSFLEGASHPEELVQQAHALGYAALAITDRNSLAGVVRAHVAAKEAGLKLLIGAEITPLDAPPVVLLATDRAAYARLSQLITYGRRNAPKGQCRLTFADVAAHAEGLLACVVWGNAEWAMRNAESAGGPEPQWSGASSGRPAGSLPEQSGVRNPKPERGAVGFGARVHTASHVAVLARYREAFGDRCYALAELHHGPDDRLHLERLTRLARAAGLPLAAANDVHYHVPQRRFLQDVLTAIRHGCPVAELGRRRFPNAERYLKPPRELQELFAACPEAVARSVEVADRCTFRLEELRYQYPEELCPPGTTPLEHLTRLTWQGARERYPAGIPRRVSQLIEHELQLIAELHYEPYFLTVWDLVRYARSRGILCQGRGSAANSAVCYCLGVTAVDPERIDVLFERFVSRERNEAPDIDVDFEHERREEVIQYVYDKYGRDRAAMTAEVITYRHRSAVRDVGKALGFSLDEVDALARSLEHTDGWAAGVDQRELPAAPAGGSAALRPQPPSPDGRKDKLAARFREAGADPESRRVRQLLRLVREIVGFPRHLSQHVGGMVITREPLWKLVPLENAAMPGRTVVEWDKDDLEALGILKVDCLALGMLTAIRKCFALIERHHGRALTLATVPAEDPAVYEMAGRADTMGVFQIESRAQMAMLPRLRPRCFYDLVIEVAIVRPGPIQGDMVHPYLRRRCGEEAVTYPDERIRGVLEKTLGVPIFQEQAMKLAVVAAGFTPGEADQLRRAMGAWRKRGEIDRFRRKLIGGMRRNGYSAAFAERLFQQIRGFGEYGFPESHAASFALLVYVSAWLKRYYPAAFAAALLNSQPMGFYAPAQLVADARRHGVEVRPVDVNSSRWDCTLEDCTREPGPLREQGRTAKPPAALRLGLRMVRGFSAAQAELVTRCRAEGPFASFEDFARRTGLSTAVLMRLARADAFGSLRLDRRGALWQSLPAREAAPLFAAEPDEPVADLPAADPLDEVVADYRMVGLSLRRHPVWFVREQLERLGVAPAAQLAHIADGAPVSVAGVVLLRQRPGTASGITFVTLEDETGLANLIVRPAVWERHHHVARTAGLMLARGRLQRQHGVMHVLVNRLEDLSPLLTRWQARSRDFR